MTNLPSVRDEIKASTISNSAKLLAGYMAATGISDAKEISESLGIPLRTVQRLKLDIAVADATSAKDATCGVSENANSANCATGGVFEAPIAPPVAFSEPCAPTRIETPSGLLTHEVSYLDSPPSAPPKPKAEPKRGKRLPLDWHLPDDWRQWARIGFAHVSEAMIEIEAEKFRDFWHAKAGQGAAKLDWQATWRNWCRQAFAPRGSAYPVNNGRASWDEQRAKRHADTRALMDRMGLGTEAVQ